MCVQFITFAQLALSYRAGRLCSPLAVLHYTQSHARPCRPRAAPTTDQQAPAGANKLTKLINWPAAALCRRAPREPLCSRGAPRSARLGPAWTSNGQLEQTTRRATGTRTGTGTASEIGTQSGRSHIVRNLISNNCQQGARRIITPRTEVL